MKSVLNLKFSPVLLIGAGTLVAWYFLSKGDEKVGTTYGEPDGEETSGEVSSFVD